MTSRSRKLIVPTVMTLAMLAVLLRLGLWQLERLAWKEKILENLTAPVVQLAVPVVLSPNMELRRVLVFCGAGFQQIKLPDHSAYTAKFHYFTKCPGKNGVAFVIDHADAEQAILADTVPKRQFTGTVRAWQPERWFDKVAGVQAITQHSFGPEPTVSPYFIKVGPPPDPENISNNHFAYALQWFGFAAVLSVVYGIYAHRVWRGR